jgi:HEAT repeat protein
MAHIKSGKLRAIAVAARERIAVLPGTPDGFASLPGKQVREAARALLVPLTSAEDAEVRAQAVKVLGESGLPGDSLPFGRLLADESLRVRAFAAIAAGRTKSRGAISSIWQMLEKNQDPYIRHAGSYALSLVCEPRQLAAMNQHPDPSVRLAGVIALRRLKDPMIAAFIRDEDPKVATEALRGIHDAGIEEARPTVAALLDED